MKTVRSRKSEVGSLKSICFIAIIALFYLATTKSTAFAVLTTEANHKYITIDLFYHGSSVSVKGTCDPDVDLVVKIASQAVHQVLKKKGKAAGFLWMNTGTLNFEHTPDFFTVQSTKKIEDILSEDERDKHIIGFPSLLKHAEISPVGNNDEKAKWFNEFVKFKEHERLYSESSGDISINSENATTKYALNAKWPYQAHPGSYEVTVYAVKNNHVVETVKTEVFVEQAGVVKYLANMAKNNGALYGIVSIIAAIGAGFGVGMIFKKGGGAH